MTLISVIIPTYNRAGPVCRAIDSVLRQSFKDFELIVIDDGSTDDTAFWLKTYSDPRLKIITTENRGVSHARNCGAKEAQGEWLCFLDSDDLWRRHKLSEQVHFHAQNRNVLISQTEDIWIRHSERINKMKKHLTREGDIFKESLKLCLITPSSVMIHKNLFWQMDGFDEALPTCEDYDLWLRVTAKHQIGFLPKTLVTKFGGHDDQLSKKYPIMDKYRLFALEKLQSNAALSDEQRTWVAQEMAEKQKIITQGEQKRKTNQ